MTLDAAAIRAWAAELGFADAGFAPAERLYGEGRHFKEWLAKGFQADMAWMERDVEKRIDAGQFLERARTVISLICNYYTAYRHTGEAGKISRYAWGDDYHDIVKENLRLLAARIAEAVPDVNTRICSDTSAFMDKAWAVRAGLGWQGKHSNLITRAIGSWVFIGAIVTDLEIKSDRPIVEDHCGTCRACLDACPTGAIVEPYVVDAAKCLSYATIELRDEMLPSGIADHMEGWLYGCDICQDVCPWNRFERPTAEVRFEPRNGETAIAPERILEMDHEAYVVRFRRSAIKRAKLPGLKRNAEALQRRRTD